MVPVDVRATTQNAPTQRVRRDGARGSRMTALVSIWLALLLCTTAGLKAWRAERAAAGLATFGLAAATARRAGIWLLIACELAIAVVLAAGSAWAPAAAAGLFAAFALVTAVALLAGRGGGAGAGVRGRARAGL